MANQLDEDPFAELDAIVKHREIVHNSENSDSTRQKSRDALCRLVLKLEQ